MNPILQLQKTRGNQFVQRIARAEKEAPEDREGLAGPVASAINRARGGGRGLDDNTKAEMEAGFSADFSNVRMHDNSESHALNRALNARAFTTGQDIHFGEGQYQPGSREGQHLIAHELAHTVQQPSPVELKAGDAVSNPEEPSEKEAERAAEHLTSAHHNG